MFTRLDDWWHTVPLAGKTILTFTAGAVLAAATVVAYDRYCWRTGISDRDRTNPGIVIQAGAGYVDPVKSDPRGP